MLVLLLLVFSRSEFIMKQPNLTSDLLNQKKGRCPCSLAVVQEESGSEPETVRAEYLKKRERGREDAGGNDLSRSHREPASRMGSAGASAERPEAVPSLFRRAAGEPFRADPDHVLFPSDIPLLSSLSSVL